MNILLVTRGSQGDVYPYLAVSRELQRRGHRVTLSVPALFEEQAKTAGVPYILQAKDEIDELVDSTARMKEYIAWMRRVVDDQFAELVPLLRENDILVAANTEFSAASIAELCGKPLIRTGYGPLLPGRRIPPPLTAYTGSNPLVVQALWGGINMGVNSMIKARINYHRTRAGMKPVSSLTEHWCEYARNYLMYSQYLGSVDSGWKYRWAIGGYCFDDVLSYDSSLYSEAIRFIKKDERPTLFFTLGSCKTDKKERICDWLHAVCARRGYKLLVGAGWWRTAWNLKGRENVFVIDGVIPHYLILPECAAFFHHGGSGTTHSCARAGKPQLILPLVIDQHYWAEQVRLLGLGPRRLKVSRLTEAMLEENLVDLLTNPTYRENARLMGEKVNAENGTEAMCRYIEGEQK